MLAIWYKVFKAIELVEYSVAFIIVALIYKRFLSKQKQADTKKRKIKILSRLTTSCFIAILLFDLDRIFVTLFELNIIKLNEMYVVLIALFGEFCLAIQYLMEINNIHKHLQFEVFYHKKNKILILEN